MVLTTGSNLELAFKLAECEWNESVAGYVTQADNFPISWTNLDGGKAGLRYTPDVIVFHKVPNPVPKDWCPATLMEIKATERLEKSRSGGSGRYQFDEALAKWRSPATEKVVRDLYGLDYKVITELDIDPLLASNVYFIRDYSVKSVPQVPL